ncbi:MAG: 1-acyl-sn-glycerol-3-phosphate acyltransferase [Polyangiaceae bacterium]|nr:1-acyl-sn-glycerol-3-phosphate acyltransferase [Polyangiaceae bacterium]MCW5790952.1 1-acyl-sn-glycerol-3-phosphate acyltransferase [Polyangiaceae bacterium]
MRPEDRERIQLEVVSRVLERHVSAARQGPGARQGAEVLETLVSDTLYHERRRLERDTPAPGELALYADIARRLPKASESELVRMIEALLARFVEEVVGNFDERVYRVSTSVVPAGLSLLLKAAGAESARDLLSVRRRTASVRDHIDVSGEVEHVRSLVDQGTLVVVPTHSSHLDSIVLGYTAHLLGLPPLLYGAGLNLFKSPLVSYFMNHLGAYRVDRKKTAALYKEVLKEYATVALELGYHNLFFPGGTRSRSGAVERHLKKGLLGTGLTAYINNLKQGRPKPRVFIVPCTISYDLVLEAETLIDDYLREVGKSRYIIEDDEFSRPRRVLNFFNEIATLEGKIAVTFGRPLDVVGNLVDGQGQSLDPRGRVVDTASYVALGRGVGGSAPEHEPQRDQQYTEELAAAVVRELRRVNVVMSTHVVAEVLMKLLGEANPGMDRYRLLRTGGGAPSFPHGLVVSRVGELLAAIREAGAPLVAGEMLGATPLQVVDDALRHFKSFHTRPVAERRGDRIFHEDRNLLLYYSNRLSGYELKRREAVPEAIRQEGG